MRNLTLNKPHMKKYIPATAGMTKATIVEWLNDELELWGVESDVNSFHISDEICQEFVDDEQEIRDTCEYEEERVDETRELILAIITKIGGAKLVAEVRENI